MKQTDRKLAKAAEPSIELSCSALSTIKSANSDARDGMALCCRRALVLAALLHTGSQKSPKALKVPCKEKSFPESKQHLPDLRAVAHGHFTPQ